MSYVSLNFRSMDCAGCQCDGCYECASANCDICCRSENADEHCSDMYHIAENKKECDFDQIN